MRYKKIISLFSTALLSVMTFVGCGTPRISDTVIEGTDPDVTRIVAPGADPAPSDTTRTPEIQVRPKQLRLQPQWGRPLRRRPQLSRRTE